MSKPKNVTFNLPPELIERYKALADKKIIPSVNAGVREAMEQYSQKIEKEIFKKEMEAAGKDPLFLEDLHESMGYFEALDISDMKENEEW